MYYIKNEINSVDDLKNELILKLSIFKNLNTELTEDFVLYCCKNTYEIIDILEHLIRLLDKND